MALIKCPMCNKRTSNIGPSCSKCGNLFSKSMKESAKIQQNSDIAAHKIDGTGLGCYTLIVLIIAVFVFMISSSWPKDHRNNAKGYCDRCGKRSAYTQGGIDLCSSCFNDFIGYLDKDN